MELNARFRRNVRGFYFWLGSMAILGAAPIAGVHLIHRGTIVARAAGVVLGAGGMLPWAWVVFSIIRRGDEYARQLHLIAFGFAFAGSLLLLMTLGWLVRADFIDPPNLMVVWLGCLVLWFVALMGAKVYFERTT